MFVGCRQCLTDAGHPFTFLRFGPRLNFMSKITAILEPDSDGTLHLPVPGAWRKLPIRIKAELEPAEGSPVGAYTDEWRAAFGSVEDESFTAPLRGGVRPAEFPES